MAEVAFLVDASRSLIAPGRPEGAGSVSLCGPCLTCVYGDLGNGAKRRTICRDNTQTTFGLKSSQLAQLAAVTAQNLPVATASYPDPHKNAMVHS